MLDAIEFLKILRPGWRKLERALRIAREKAMHDHVSRCYANLASSCVQFRRYPQARHWLKEGLEYTTARDLDLYSVYLLGWQAQLCFETGHWAQAEENAHETLRLARYETITPIPALIAMGHLKVRQGDPTRWSSWIRPALYRSRPVSSNGSGRWRPRAPKPPGGRVTDPGCGRSSRRLRAGLEPKRSLDFRTACLLDVARRCARHPCG